MQTRIANAVLSFTSIFITMTAATSQAQSFEKVLTSTKENLQVDSFEVNNSKVPLKTKLAWSIKKTTLHGGKQEGVDLITINNGKMSITVIPTRGMNLLAVDMGSIHLGWNSPVKEVVHPKLINLESRGGLGWLEGFNEWMVRCGLEFAGHPGKDKFINNTGDEAEMDLTLHGKIGNIPASEVVVRVEKSNPPRLVVRGRVDERMFYGPKLEMWTEVSTTLGSDEFTLHDTVQNQGAFDQEFQIIYHANYGPPLLEKGSRFVAAVKQVTPFNDHAAKSVDDFETYAAPSKGFIEQVYCVHPYADSSGKTTIMLQNSQGNKGVAMKFSTAELPYVTLWKNTSAVEEGYVTGLEPGTGFPYNRKFERKAGRVPKLKPNETRHFSLDIRVLDSSAGVARTAEEIIAIKSNRPTQQDRQHRKPE